MYSKNRIKFINPNKNDFFPTLKKRVDAYFEEQQISKHGNTAMFIKTVALVGAYIIPFVLYLTLQPGLGISLALWFIMGLGLAGIGMSVMHDANHGAYSSNKSINKFMGYTLNLAGAAVFNWKLQHNILHHTYTNISGLDEDIEDRLVLKFSPHSSVKGFHQFQWIYAFLFYGLITLYWVVAKDFVQFKTFINNGVNPNSPTENRVLFLKIVITKLVYFFVLLITPIFIFHLPVGQVLAGFMLMHFVAGIILTVVFQLAHTVEGTAHPLPNASGNIENDWAIHQLNTTVNFSPDNKWISWYVGGLNYQVEHHLFPRICHVHYPRIAGIVQATATEYGIPYLQNQTFGQALQSHIATLHRFGRLPNLNTAIG